MATSCWVVMARGCVGVASWWSELSGCWLFGGDFGDGGSGSGVLSSDPTHAGRQPILTERQNSFTAELLGERTSVR